MATPAPTVNRAVGGANSIVSAAWALGNADTGVAVEYTDWADRSIQVEGTFGSATITIEGSNDGTNYETLRDPQGNLLTFTGAGLKQVLETTRYIRVKSAGGTGTIIVVTMIARMLSARAWS